MEQQTLRAELENDISLRQLGLRLVPHFGRVRLLPKCTNVAGQTDEPGTHLHPFVLKVLVDDRNITIGITDVETHPTSVAKKPPRERKLVGQHVYVQGAPQCTRRALDVVLYVVEEMFPGNVVDTPSKGALWARPTGRRSTCQDVLLPGEGHGGVRLVAPVEALLPPPPILTTVVAPSGDINLPHGRVVAERYLDPASRDAWLDLPAVYGGWLFEKHLPRKGFSLYQYFEAPDEHDKIFYWYSDALPNSYLEIIDGIPSQPVPL